MVLTHADHLLRAITEASNATACGTALSLIPEKRVRQAYSLTVDASFLMYAPRHPWYDLRFVL